VSCSNECATIQSYTIPLLQSRFGKIPSCSWPSHSSDVVKWSSRDSCTARTAATVTCKRRSVVSGTQYTGYSRTSYYHGCVLWFRQLAYVGLIVERRDCRHGYWVVEYVVVAQRSLSQSLSQASLISRPHRPLRCHVHDNVSLKRTVFSSRQRFLTVERTNLFCPFSLKRPHICTLFALMVLHEIPVLSPRRYISLRNRDQDSETICWHKEAVFVT